MPLKGVGGFSGYVAKGRNFCARLIAHACLIAGLCAPVTVCFTFVFLWYYEDVTYKRGIKMIISSVGLKEVGFALWNAAHIVNGAVLSAANRTGLCVTHHEGLEAYRQAHLSMVQKPKALTQ